MSILLERRKERQVKSLLNETFEIGDDNLFKNGGGGSEVVRTEV
jgi:hypothetical protein